MGWQTHTLLNLFQPCPLRLPPDSRQAAAPPARCAVVEENQHSKRVAAVSAVLTVSLSHAATVALSKAKLL
jgi:hypothetical protein